MHLIQKIAATDILFPITFPQLLVI